MTVAGTDGFWQRLGLGAALLGEPELVFLDEPPSALDPVGRRDVRQIIRGLAARGSAVFLNAHLLSEVEQLCDRVAVVDHGRVIAAGLTNYSSGDLLRIRGAHSRQIEDLLGYHYGDEVIHRNNLVLL